MKLSNNDIDFFSLIIQTNKHLTFREALVFMATTRDMKIGVTYINLEGK